MASDSTRELGRELLPSEGVRVDRDPRPAITDEHEAMKRTAVVGRDFLERSRADPAVNSVGDRLHGLGALRGVGPHVDVMEVVAPCARDGSHKRSIGDGVARRRHEHLAIARYPRFAWPRLITEPREGERQARRDQLMAMIHELKVQVWLGRVAGVAAAAKQLTAAYPLTPLDHRGALL